VFRKKILVLIQPRNGGSTRHIRQLVDWLVARGSEVHVFCDPRMDVLPELGSGVVVWTRTMKRRPTLGDVRSVIYLKRLIEREQFDVVHAHSSKAGALARIATALAGGGPRVLYTPHGFAFRNPEVAHAMQLVFWGVERRLVRWTDGIIALCRTELEDAASLAPGSKAFLATNGVAAVPLAKRSREDSHRLVIAYVGRLARMKGVDVLVEALPVIFWDLPSVEVWIIGDGPQRRDIERRLERLGIQDRVQLLGARSDVSSLWGDIDILVVPSRFESQPLVLLEGMMAGRAIVATDVGGMGDLVTSGVDGMLVPPNSAGALARAVLQLAKSPTERQRLMESAATTARERVSIEAMLRSHQPIYDEMLNGTVEARTGRRQRA
jgi:glycosyltransferase involved in cell wall biosynthesis